MVRVRLLISLFMVTATIGGCGIIPRWSPPIEGRIVMAETQQPVSGAVIFSSYALANAWGAMGPGPGSLSLDLRWSTTDAMGRFTIGGGWREESPWWFGRWAAYPRIRVAHSDHGFFFLDPWAAPRNIESAEDQPEGHLLLIIAPDAASKPNLNRLTAEGMCRGHAPTLDACTRLCEVLYGSTELCENIIQQLPPKPNRAAR